MKFSTTLKGVFEERKMKKLDEARIKISENHAQLQRLNDDRPLLP